MRKLLCLLVGMAMLTHAVFSQTIDVSGKVSDEKGTPVVGASVQEKSSNKGTTTDQNGFFKINTSKGATLVISSIGFDRLEVVVSESTVSISLKSSNQALTEVVVTALGIKREKKALGYAVSTVDKKALELRPESDVVRLLQGKAAGVDILAPSGISGSGTNIIIRGVNTISGSSTPLFIVDGVPFDASTRPQADFQYGNITTSRFLDLDPNNIESISVLKGLSATTLYGELGRNGVVLITTKNGSTSRRSNKKMEISVSQSYFVNKVANLPEYQDSYGSGFDQSLGLAFFSNWGAPFRTPPDSVIHPYNTAALNPVFPQYVGAKYALKPFNSVENFFRTGTIRTTSVNLSAVGSVGNLNGNYSYMDDIGFTPGNRLIKNTFGLGGTAKLSNNVIFSGTVNYAITDFASPPTSPSFGSNPVVSSIFGNLLYTPRAVDLMGLPWENPSDHSSIYYRPANDIQHPIWTVNNSFTGQKVHRIFGNMQLKYDIVKDLSVSYRLGYDQYSDYNYLSQNKGGRVGGDQYTLGIHRTVDGHNTIWDHTFIANYGKSLNEQWTLNVDAGVNSQERIYEQRGMKSTQQLVYGLFDHDNFIVHENTSEGGTGIDFKSRAQTVGVFAQALIGYREFLYFTVGGRNSWSSNLEEENRSLFYPSGSVSFVPTSAIPSLQGSKWVNYLKLRAGYSTSANFGRPYSTRPTLNITTNVFSDKVGTVINTNTISNRLANPDLKPELLREVEVGVEGKFINNRLTVDLTLYKRVSDDQILDRDLDPATGFTVTSINAGSVENKGIELALGYTVIRNSDWRWQLDANYTLNRSLVYDIPADVKQIVVDGYTNQGLFAMNGQPLGVIQATYTIRDPKNNNQPVVNGNGDYVVSQEIGIIGDPTPTYRLTGISTLDFKGFSFRMQWDYTHGGDMLAYTPGSVVGRGLSKDTDFDRYLPFILPGVKQDGTPNDIQISASQAYFNNLSGFFGSNDLITYDATCIRLREASLSYSLPESVLAKSPIGAVSITISGQNLWYNAPNFPKYVNFDPETSSLGVSNVRGLEFLSGPTSRRLGASVRVTF